MKFAFFLITTNGITHVFMCLLAIWVFIGAGAGGRGGGEWLLKSLAHFSVGLSVFFSSIGSSLYILNMSSLYILDMSLLSFIYIIEIFFWPTACFFTYFMVPSDEQCLILI